MGRKNSQGQIMAEVALVMGIAMVFLLVGLSQMSQFKKVHNKYQFQKDRHEKFQNRSR